MSETNAPKFVSDTYAQAIGHGADWLKWVGHLSGQPNVRGMEIGCWLGESAEWYLDHICDHPSSSMDTVDHFLGSAEHQLAGIDCGPNEEIARKRLERFGERCRIHKMSSDAFMLQETWRRPQYDFFYLDGSHDAKSVLRDVVLAFDLLKVGGVAICDDLEWDVFKDPVDRPKIALEAFVACYARNVEIIGKGWQLAFRKTAP